jgi:hypothetical protein
MLPPKTALLPSPSRKSGAPIPWASNADKPITTAATREELPRAKEISTVATPKLALLTDLLTTGAGRGRGPIESPLHRGQFPQPHSIAFTLHTPRYLSLAGIPPQHLIFCPFLPLYLIV